MRGREIASSTEIFAAALELAVDLVLPPQCIHCGGWLSSARPAACSACISQLEPPGTAGCARCGLVLARSAKVCWRCRDWPPELTAIAAVRYQGVAETIVRAIKYSGWRHLADICAERMADSIRLRGHRLDILVPVPLHPLRYRERGFNQARLIADRLATRIDRPILDALERSRTTPPQVGLGRVDRVANVSGAFTKRTSLERGARIGLIDDVATSGATLHAAADALIAGGASRVVGVTFALATDRNAG